MVTYVVQIKWLDAQHPFWSDDSVFFSFEEAQRCVDDLPHPEGRYEVRIVRRFIQETVL